jgi:hypothetical protein
MTPEDRELLVRRAESTRSRLSKTIDALDQRRFELARLAEQGKQFLLQAKQFVVPAAVAAGVIVVAATGTVVFGWLRSRRGVINTIGLRMERIAKAGRRPSWFMEVGRNALISTLSFVAVQMAKKQLTRMLPEMTETDHPSEALPSGAIYTRPTSTASPAIPRPPL